MMWWCGCKCDSLTQNSSNWCQDSLTMFFFYLKNTVASHLTDFRPVVRSNGVTIVYTVR